LKRLDSSPRTSGAAAVLVGRADEKRSAVVATGFGSFANGRTAGAHMVPGDTSYFDGADLARAASAAYAMAGVSKPDEQVDVAEVYASFGIIELISIEALGLAGGGNGARMLKEGRFHRDSALAVNASGGATCGNPISSAGLLRVIEAALQLRGQAGDRQVTNPVRRAVVSAIGGLFQLHEVGVLEA
jgi:acetyl-CoA C-acetyltransferase